MIMINYPEKNVSSIKILKWDDFAAADQHPDVKQRNVGDPGNILSHLNNKGKECQQRYSENAWKHKSAKNAKSQ